MTLIEFLYYPHFLIKYEREIFVEDLEARGMNSNSLAVNEVRNFIDVSF